MKEILLTYDKVAFVDDEDWERISKYIWHAQTIRRTTYAIRREDHDRSIIYMHRQILQMKLSTDHVDHIDGNGLNNCKENLRRVTNQQNHFNMRKGSNRVFSSTFKGVCWDKARKKWLASIELAQKQRFLGRYNTEIEAAQVYDAAAKKLFGEFARLNFPETNSL